jgi:Fe-Mn family superoxide dismutase
VFYIQPIISTVMKYITFLFSMLLAIAATAQPFTLPRLPYTYAALEPHVDARTMEIHHTRHHQGYVTNLNKAVAGTPHENLSIVELMLKVSSHSTAIRNNGGGHYNHSLFWEILSPTPQTTPATSLQFAIQQSFGSMDSLRKALNQAALTQFGSGWAWLIVTPDKKLVVTSTPNQDNPLMDVVAVRGIPIVGIDVWEHAYYLHYQNRRGDYLGAIWNVLDWYTISAKYEAALKSPLLDQLK